MGRPFKIFITAVFSIVLSASPVMCISAGRGAPYFKVVSGNGEVLTPDALKNKVAVVFYETKDTTERNRPLKEALNAFYESLSPAAQKGIARAAIIRCSAFLPAVWRRNLREHSKKEGIVIYGDWDGSMAKDYGMAADETNFFIIDKTGIVRYSRTGAVPCAVTYLWHSRGMAV